MIKYLVYDDKMLHKMSTEDSLKSAISFLCRKNNKHGNVVMTLEDGKEFYKVYGIQKGKVKAEMRYTEGRRFR